MDLKNFGFSIIGLIIGALLAGWVIPMFPFQVSGWLYGILFGTIQMVVLVVLGVVTGSDLITVILGGVVIYVGSIAGGFVSDFIGMSGMFSTLVIVAVQTVVLMATGFIKGTKPVVPLAKAAK